jgi:2-oxoglutarate/2-oxoacid ferredoxin oxidoreductase subunit alpha
VSRRTDDLTVMATGQGGDGSLTLVDLLGNLLGRRGFHLYQSRNVASRVKGGAATACLRASSVPRGGLGDRFDLAVAFDEEGLDTAWPWLDERSYLIHDSSDQPLAARSVRNGVKVLELPFGRIAVRELRRDLYKNVVAYAVAIRLVGAPDADAEAALRESLQQRSTQLVDANLRALREGFGYADANGLAAGQSPWTLEPCPAAGRVLLSGNQAVAFGFLAAGGRFFAGYPPKPATEILEWLSARLPEFGGVAVQAEDELSAISLALGAALTGTRAMTASSGPGIALMQEGVGHLGSAEVGVVIVDCQRAGPSTGMPTKPEQSDIGMLVYGANGDFPRLVLAPGDPADAFELAVLAVNLAERYQGPVYLVLDQVIAQDAMSVPRLDLDSVRIDRGKLLGEEELAALSEYRRYSFAADGISPWVPMGRPGAQHLVTGNERDEWGRVSAQPGMRSRMVEKRARKLDAVRADLPRGRRFGEPSAQVGVLGFGMETGVMREVVERSKAGGVPVQGLQVRTLWPVLEDVAQFVADCERVYVVEHNATGQYARVLDAEGIAPGRLRSVLRYDGLPFRPAELEARILAEVGA